MKRKKPSFDESYYGYRSFTHLMEDADDLALVDIERNPKSGTYVVTRICGEGEGRPHQGPRRRPAGLPGRLFPILGTTREEPATVSNRGEMAGKIAFPPGSQGPRLSSKPSPHNCSNSLHAGNLGDQGTSP